MLTFRSLSKVVLITLLPASLLTACGGGSSNDYAYHTAAQQPSSVSLGYNGLILRMDNQDYIATGTIDQVIDSNTTTTRTTTKLHRQLKGTQQQNLHNVTRFNYGIGTTESSGAS